MGICVDSDPSVAWVELIRSGQRVVDVGANVGTYTRLFSQQVGSKGVVHAIEPGPKLFDRLRLEASDLLNVRLYRYALGNRSGTHHVFHFQNWTLLPTDEQDSRYHNRQYTQVSQNHSLKEEFSVLFMTLDEFVAENGLVDWIKLDVDGAELEVLRGAKVVLRDVRPCWMIEIGKYTTAYFGGTPEDIVSLMGSYNYRFHHYQTYAEMTPSEVAAVAPDTTLDVLCVPANRSWPPYGE